MSRLIVSEWWCIEESFQHDEMCVYEWAVRISMHEYTDWIYVIFYDSVKTYQKFLSDIFGWSHVSVLWIGTLIQTISSVLCSFSLSVSFWKLDRLAFCIGVLEFELCSSALVGQYCYVSSVVCELGLSSCMILSFFAVYVTSSIIVILLNRRHINCVVWVIVLHFNQQVFLILADVSDWTLRLCNVKKHYTPIAVWRSWS